MKNTLKEIIKETLKEIKKGSYKDVYDKIIKDGSYNFGESKTPDASVSSILGDFIRNKDKFIYREEIDNKNIYFYSDDIELSNNIESNNKTNNNIELSNNIESNIKINNIGKYNERDLHILLSTYLKLNNFNIYIKTIYHEESNSKDANQKWAHPDMIGIKFLELENETVQNFAKSLSYVDNFELYSYELKKEINTDYDLKESFFQAVSNSTWANYGYLVAYKFNTKLVNEMERLNKAHGIGFIELNSLQNKILFESKKNNLDIETISKLCKINPNFEKFIDYIYRINNVDNILNLKDIKNTFINTFCDKFLLNNEEFKQHCINKNIPLY